MLANASSDEGPTLVPHMLNPMLYQFNDLPARNNLSFFLRCLMLTLNPMNSNMSR